MLYYILKMDSLQNKSWLHISVANSWYYIMNMINKIILYIECLNAYNL